MTLLFLGASQLVSTLFLVAFLVGVPVAIAILMRRSRNTQAPLDWRGQATARAMAEGNASAILDGAFDGRPTVAYDPRPLDAVSAQTAMAGAVERGYTFVREDDGMLVFELKPGPGR